MHPLGSALPLPFVPARVTRGVLVAHRHSFAAPRCRTSQYRRTFAPHSISLCNDLSDPVFDGVGLAGFKTRAILFFLYVSNFISLFLPSAGWLCGVGVLGLIGCSHSLLALHC